MNFKCRVLRNAVLLTFFSLTLGVDVSRRFTSLLCLWLRSSKELESDNVFLLLLLLLLLSYFGIWLARFKVRCIELFHPSWAVSRKGCTGIDTIRGGGVCTVCIESRCTVHVYLLASLIFYFLLMFCAQRFTKVESMGGLFVDLGKGGPPDLI